MPQSGISNARGIYGRQIVGIKASGRAGGGASLGVGLDRDLYLELGRLMRDRR